MSSKKFCLLYIFSIFIISCSSSTNSDCAYIKDEKVLNFSYPDPTERQKVFECHQKAWGKTINDPFVEPPMKTIKLGAE